MITSCFSQHVSSDEYKPFILWTIPQLGLVLSQLNSGCPFSARAVVPWPSQGVMLEAPMAAAPFTPGDVNSDQLVQGCLPGSPTGKSATRLL